jgi:hypothetical protein
VSAEHRPGPPDPRLEDFPSLVAFGDRLARAPRRRLSRPVGRGGLSVLVAFVGTTGLALTAATGSPVPPFLRAAAESPVVRPEPSTVRISAARAADPAGGLPWTVRVGSAGDGTRCVSVGQVRGGRLGIEGPTGRFDALGADADAGCGQLEDGGAAAGVPVVGIRDLAALTGRRLRATVVFGVARPGTDRVRALLPNGRVVRASLAPDGSFVAIVPGEPRQAQPIVDVRDGSGGVHVPFHRGHTLPDPDPAGRPWTLEAGNDAPRDRGRPATGGADEICFRIHPVAPFVGWDRRTPAVCGIRPGAGATVTALRAGARGRFAVGRTPVPVDWTGLPTRTLVTVRIPAARGVVVLRARGRAWAVRRVGSAVTGRKDEDGVYLGLLPGVVRASDVRVDVRGARSTTSLPVRQVDLLTDGGTP